MECLPACFRKQLILLHRPISIVKMMIMKKKNVIEQLAYMVETFDITEKFEILGWVTAMQGVQLLGAFVYSSTKYDRVLLCV